MKDRLSKFHPLVILIYYLAVTLFTVLFVHPAVGGVSAFCAAATLLLLGGAPSLRAVFFSFLTVPVAVLVNGLFVNLGVSVVFYLGDRPVTAESLLYGLSAGLMMCAVLLWSMAFLKVFDSDKMLYLLKRAAPSAAVLLSMSVRLLPLLKNRFTAIREGRKGLLGGEKTGVGADELSALTTWALEDGADTADSMTARGFGTHRRTAYRAYKFRRGDGMGVAAVVTLTAVAAIPILLGGYAVEFYPAFTLTGGILCPVLFLTLGLIPVGTVLYDRVRISFTGAFHEEGAADE